MNWIRLSIEQPKTIAVAVILVILSGMVALDRAPIQMSPEVDILVIAITTNWENASPQEVETEVIDEQEERLQGVGGLVSMTSISQAGRGQIRLEFQTGTDKREAMQEVGEKLREVPEYPDGVDEPEIIDTDPESVDYIAWIGLATSDPDFDASTLYDFMNKRLRPRFERIPGIAEVGIRGAREKEVQIRIDPVRLAQRGITMSELETALQLTNDNWSAGLLPDGKNDIRIRTLGRFNSAEQVKNSVIRHEASGPVYIRDVATVVETYKEMTDFVRARGHLMPFFNFQREIGSNLLDVMDALQAEVDALNAPGGLLEQHAKELGLDGTLELVQSYDQTGYVIQALDLVQNNILYGGILATLALLVFLRSVRSVIIIGIAIPISIIASIIVLALLGRSINIISLAGMAFAVGMVVDNSIVVLENIYRHLEKGKQPAMAALHGAREVGSAVLASTLTTIVVFIPILLIQESAGQLFQDIAIAIVGAVGVSMLVSLTVIPATSSLLLRQSDTGRDGSTPRMTLMERFARTISSFVYWLTGTRITRVVVLALFVVLTLGGIYILTPPLDYLPMGNRNVTFGVISPPPGYNVNQLFDLAERIESRIRPAWEASENKFLIEDRIEGEDAEPLPVDELPMVPISPEPGAPMTRVPALSHYFLVAFDGQIFQVAIVEENDRTVDSLSLFAHATQDAVTPGVMSFAFQFPLFSIGGRSGSAVKIDITGSDLDRISASASALMTRLGEQYGPFATQPDPNNFMLPTPELQVIPDDIRLSELQMSRRDVGLLVQANGDGMFVGEYELDGELKDLKVISHRALEQDPLFRFEDLPMATPGGEVIPLRSVASLQRVVEPKAIKRVGRERAVTLQFTPPPTLPLQEAIDSIYTNIDELRASGDIAPDLAINLAGSASKLDAMKIALLGDGSLFGLLQSSLFLAFLVVYLMMVVLFQSWLYPLVIMVSVPLATLGGFIGLGGVHTWSQIDRYMPIQNMDMLTILGFVILAGVVVNNAILLVHQTLNFMSKTDQDGNPQEPMQTREAIREAVHTRVRPILMSMVTSVGGMLPLILMPGAGSELYRGLGSVVVGGLVVSTVFTLVLVPLILGMVIRAAKESPFTSLES